MPYTDWRRQVRRFTRDVVRSSVPVILIVWAAWGGIVLAIGRPVPFTAVLCTAGALITLFYRWVFVKLEIARFLHSSRRPKQRDATRERA